MVRTCGPASQRPKRLLIQAGPTMRVLSGAVVSNECLDFCNVALGRVGGHEKLTSGRHGLRGLHLVFDRSV